jgi:hypothetical protein
VARYFTVAIESEPLARDLTDDELEAFAVAVDAGKILMAAAIGYSVPSRILSATACIDVQDEDVARDMAAAAFTRAARGAGIGPVEVALIELTPDGSEEE